MATKVKSKTTFNANNIVETCKFIPYSALLDQVAVEHIDQISCLISESAPFSWGDNNRSMVSPSRLLDHAEDALEGEEGAEEFIAAVKAIPENVYVDMEN